jgi:MFS family permease
MNPATSERPTHARHTVIAFAVTLAVLSYVSRVCISQAAAQKPLPGHPSTLVGDLHLTTQQLGWIFGAFSISYALFEIPTGWLGDWLGPRRVLMRIVIWWSVFTAASGWMWNAASLMVVRFLFGAGEAGAFPNLTKVFTTWLPHRERLRAQAIMWTAARWGGAFTPPLVVLLLVYLNWRWTFVVFGALGVVWAVLFFFWFRDDPRRHPGVNAAEAAIIGDAPRNATGHGDVPWGRLVRSRSVWLLWTQYFCLTFPWTFYITWLPNYLKSWNLTDRAASSLAVLPLLCGGIGCMFCGAISPLLARRLGDVRRCRRLTGVAGFVGAACFLAMATQAQSALWAMFAMGMASFWNDVTMPPAWTAVMDIGGKYAGTVSGSMNMMGNLAGFVAPAVGGWLIHDFMDRSGYNSFIWLMAAVYVGGAVCWRFIDPVTPLDPDATSH